MTNITYVIHLLSVLNKSVEKHFFQIGLAHCEHPCFIVFHSHLWPEIINTSCYALMGKLLTKLEFYFKVSSMEFFSGQFTVTLKMDD